MSGGAGTALERQWGSAQGTRLADDLGLDVAAQAHQEAGFSHHEQGADQQADEVIDEGGLAAFEVVATN